MSDESGARLEAHLIHERYCASLREVAEALCRYPFLRTEEQALEQTAAHASTPFHVAVFGRMKTGKSSLINALIGRPLAITGVEETTATVNRLTYAEGTVLKTFTVHWKDDAPRSFPLEELQRDWSGTEKAVLDRVSKTAWLELYSNVPVLRDIHIIDTPGTGSTAMEHEETARQFISGQNANALVYVFSPVGRETDEEALTTFRQGCLPGSSPDNSVAVLHKWDHLYWDNGGDIGNIAAKARRLHYAMGALVADVLAVSAPLALASKYASPLFWEQCLAVLAEFDTDEDLTRTLGRDAKWGRSPDRSSLYLQAREYGLPWSSFQIMLRELYRNSPRSAEDARMGIRTLSGIDALERLLDQQFFKRSAIIRQRQTRARTQKVLRTIYDKIEADLQERQKNISMFDRLEKEVASPDIRAWIDRQRFACRNDYDRLCRQWTEIDKLVIREERKQEREDEALQLRHWLESPSCRFTDRQISLLKSMLQHPGKNNDNRRGVPCRASMEELSVLLRHVSSLCVEPDRTMRRHAEMLRSHLMQAIALLPNTQPSAQPSSESTRTTVRHLTPHEQAGEGGEMEIGLRSDESQAELPSTDKEESGIVRHPASSPDAATDNPPS